MKTVPRACAPYDMGPGRAAPVDLWNMISRLTEQELRELAIGYSVHAPRFFETQLMEFGARPEWRPE